MRTAVKDKKLTHELIMELYDTQLPHSFIYTFENGERMRITDAVITQLNPDFSGSSTRIDKVRMRFVGQHSLSEFGHSMILVVSKLEF